MARNRVSVSISVPEDQREDFYEAVTSLMQRLGSRNRSTLAVDLITAQAAGTIDHVIESAVHANQGDDHEVVLEERPIFVISVSPERKEAFDAALDHLKNQSPGSTSSIVVRLIRDIWRTVQATLAHAGGNGNRHAPSLPAAAHMRQNRSPEDILCMAQEHIPADFACQGTSALDVRVLGNRFYDLDRQRRIDWLSDPDAELPPLDFLLIHGWLRFINGRTRELRSELPTIVQRLDHAMAQAEPPLEKLTQWYQFAAIVARDTGDYDMAFDGINKAIEIAYRLYHDQASGANHIASALYRRASLFRQQMWDPSHMDKGHLLALQAVNDMEEASALASLCRLPVRLVIDSCLAVTRASMSDIPLAEEQLHALFEDIYIETERIPDQMIADETGLIFHRAGIWHRHAQIALALGRRTRPTHQAADREMREHDRPFRDFVSVARALALIDQAIHSPAWEYERWAYDMRVTQIGLQILDHRESVALRSGKEVLKRFQIVDSHRITLKLRRLIASIEPMDKYRLEILDRLNEKLPEP